MLGNFSARLFSSHASLNISNRQGLSRGSHFDTKSLEHESVASARERLRKNLIKI